MAAPTPFDATARGTSQTSSSFARVIVLLGALLAGCGGVPDAQTSPAEAATRSLPDSDVSKTAAALTQVFRADLPTPSEYPDVLLDAAESTSGWSGTQLDTTAFKRGRASLKRSSATSRFFRSFATPVDVSKLRFLTFWYYIDDPSKIVDADQQIEIGSAGTYDQQERNWPVSSLRLHRGWNYVVLDIAGARHRTVNGVQADLKKINWFRIYHHPNATITTRIDQIVFTNRAPASLAFSQYLDGKESLLRHPDGAGLAETAELAALLRLPVNDARRKRECRALQLVRQRRAVSQFTLDALVVGTNAVSAARTVEAHVCGELSIALGFDEVVRGLAKNYLAAEVDVVQKVATRFGLPESEAAETASKLFELDYDRILATCGTVQSEVANFIRTGAKPAGITGPNAFFRNCAVSSQNNLGQEISVRIGGGRSLTGAGDKYRACWDAFANQGSDCSNPYAAPIDDFGDALGRIPTFQQQPQLKEDAIDIVGGKLGVIETITLPQANQIIDEYNEEQGASTVPNVDPSAASDHPRRAELEALHRQYDDERGRAAVARVYEQNALRNSELTAESDPDFSLAGQAAAEAYHRTATEHEIEAETARAKICAIDPENAICKDAPPPEPPGTGPGSPKPDDDPGAVARCSEFNVGADAAWYETPTGSGGSRELNGVDRIEHCLCDVFDRQYPDLPQFQIVKGVNVNSFCPSPEERVMHECTQPGWDDGPPSPLCTLGLASRDLTRDELTSRLCWAMRSSTCPDPRILSNGECNCATPPAPGGSQPPPRKCQQVVNCGPDGIPDDQGCGCRQFDSPRICAGNVLTEARPVLNTFAGVTALAGRPTLSVSTSMPIVTRAVTRDVLTNGNAFAFKVFNPNDGGAMTATADVRCTNLERGVSNYLVDRVALASLGSGTVANASAAFSTADLDRCFGTARTDASHLEIAMKTSRAVPRIAYVADLNFANILDPIFPAEPCTLPTVGPTPRPTWNMSTGQVLRRDVQISYPVMQASGLITSAFVVTEPTYFVKDYAPSSLNLLDRRTVATSSQLAVTRAGNVDTVTLQINLRGNSRASRYSAALVAPNGTEMYRVTSLQGDGELFDAGTIIDPAATITSQGTWTLNVFDLGGTNGGAKSGDLYSWSLNFNPSAAFDEPGSFPAGWGCDGRDGFEDFPGQFYGDGACDCGCGALDSDCASNNLSQCEFQYCAPSQSVNPSNIATCQ